VRERAIVRNKLFSFKDRSRKKRKVIAARETMMSR
jgi:hypothetical protein